MTITMLSEARPSAVGSVRSLAEELRAVVGSLDAAALSVLPGREATALAGLFASIERLAGAGKTLAAGRVAETGQYRAEGHPSAARWLSDVTKASFSEARRTITTAAHLGDDSMGEVRDAFVGGGLTGDQASEIVGAVSAAPEEERRLLDLASAGTAKALRDECRKVRLAGRPAERPEDRRRRLVDEMRFSTRSHGDGMSDLFARMPTSWMARVLAAVREQTDVVFAAARAAGRDDPHQAYRVEALVTLLLFGPFGAPGASGSAGPAGSSADDISGDGGGADGLVEEDDKGDADPVGKAERPMAEDAGTCAIDDPDYAALLAMLWGEPPPEPPPRAHRRRRRRSAVRGSPRAKIVVRVDQSALLRGWAEGDETCEIAGIGPVPVATVRDLWPDAVVKLVITAGVDVVNVTHLGRRATEAMTTAMQWRPPVCTNVACDNDRFLEIDLRLGYANVHRTRLDELDGLCTECHRHKTVDNWQLARGTGRRRFVPPEHPDHPGDPPTPVRRRA